MPRTVAAYLECEPCRKAESLRETGLSELFPAEPGGSRASWVPCCLSHTVGNEAFPPQTRPHTVSCFLPHTVGSLAGRVRANTPGSIIWKHTHQATVFALGWHSDTNTPGSGWAPRLQGGPKAQGAPQARVPRHLCRWTVPQSRPLHLG